MVRLLTPWFLALAVALAPTPPTQAAQESVTPEQIKKVASDLVCLCGSCPRESLSTCMCTAFAVPQREVIGRALGAGQGREQIVQEFVDRFGMMVLAEPPPGGYRLVSWLTPTAILLVGIIVVRSVLVSWRRRTPEPETTTAAAATSDADDHTGSSYDEQLKRDLDAYDD